MRIQIGTRVWLYGTLPVGRVVGFGEVESIHEHAPHTIWEQFGNHAGVSKEAFFRYFDGVRAGCAIVFRKVVPLERELSLNELRGLLGRFVAPQFFRRLSPGSHELALLESALHDVLPQVVEQRQSDRKLKTSVTVPMVDQLSSGECRTKDQ